MPAPRAPLAALARLLAPVLLAPALLAPVLLAVPLAACGDDPFGFEEATRFDFEAEVPITLRLPPQALPAAPVDLKVPLSVRVPFDVVAELRAQGYEKEADALKENKSRLERVELRAVDYEVPYPNLVAASLGPLAVAFGDDAAPDAPLGRTVAIPAGKAIATREVDYAEGGLDAAGAMLHNLNFVLAARGEVSVPAGEAVEAETVVIQLRLHLWFEASLL